MQKTHRHILSALATLVSITQARAQQQPVLRYEPAVVELSGTVKLERHYGPPNFGESPRTDAVYTVPILVLKTPVTVQADSPSPRMPVPVNSQTFHNVTRMQLIFGTPSTNIAGLHDEPVTVTGTLFQKITGGHYTDVLVQVKAFSLGAPRSP